MTGLGCQVDGIFSCDPARHPEAVRHTALTYQDVHLQKLQVMDQTAITLCEENNIPVVVYNVYSAGHLVRVLKGDGTIGTIVSANPLSCYDASMAGEHASSLAS
jgi:uridylate kinase